MSLPSGVVTFVFSDIEESTKLWESDPEGMRASLGHHDEIARRIVTAGNGIVFKHTGDGFGAAFDSVNSGIEAAARFAAAVAGEEWPGPTLTCRIGVHAGEAEPTEGDYFGTTVTRTARIMEAGNGGQILVSEAVRLLLGQRPGSGVSLVDVGEHRLKDLGEPTRIYRLMGAGADDPRELRTLQRAPHNLPIQLSSFVGREGQIKEITDLVRHSRLVTLTGIGGVGKTRLALQVAAELLAEFDQGAWLIELAPLTDGVFLADTVASGLGVPEDPNLTAEARLLRFLPSRRALLVMDNCEHLIDDVAALVDSTLRTCPDVRILTTSREGLAVPGEVLWRVPSLRVDDDAAAVELFAERARLVQPNFRVNEDNRAAVADLCVRLDGIPLAIELATARLKMLSLEQISQNLSDRFRLLTGGSRTAVERQRTLRAMMDWSYDLLSVREQALLRRLAVFSDGLTYEAAEDVCSSDTLTGFEVLDLLGRLVEASVVTFEADPRPRYRLLETVRQYALEKLVEAGEADEARRRHAEHFVAAARQLDASLLGGDLELIEVATDDLSNYRSAITWASEAGAGVMALDLACHLRNYFWNRSMFREGLIWLTSALDLVSDQESPLVAIGTAYALTDATNVGGNAPILELAGRARRILADSRDDRSRGVLSNSLASLEMSINVERADQLFAEATQLLRRANDPRWTSPVQNRFLCAWFMNSRESESEILTLIGEAGDLFRPDVARVGRTVFKVLAEEYADVIASTEIMSQHDEYANIMLILYRMQAHRAIGRPEAALEDLKKFKAMPSAITDGWRGWHEAMAHMQLGDLDTAIERFSAPGAYNTDLPPAHDRANVAWFWSLIAERRGEHASGAVLLGFARSLSEKASVSLLAFDLGLVEKSRSAIRETLGEDDYEALISHGATIRWEELPLVHQQRHGERTA
jgi:predicted ATPase/class 3 adenylate cyclase